jgi:hypothetical protein
MEKQFIEAIKKVSTYKKKEGTSSSYYRVSGAEILPERLSLSFGTEMVQTARKGRNLMHEVVGQLIASFKKTEQSPLKQYKPFKVRTNIYKDMNYPLLIGYGTIGISNQEGQITKDSDKGDLVIFCSQDKEKKEICIYFFAGGLMDLLDIEEYITTLLISKGLPSQTAPFYLGY